MYIKINSSQKFEHLQSKFVFLENEKIYIKLYLNEKRQYRQYGTANFNSTRQFRTETFNNKRFQQIPNAKL